MEHDRHLHAQAQRIRAHMDRLGRHWRIHAGPLLWLERAGPDCGSAQCSMNTLATEQCEPGDIPAEMKESPTHVCVADCVEQDDAQLERRSDRGRLTWVEIQARRD